jgi:catalase
MTDRLGEETPAKKDTIYGKEEKGRGLSLLEDFHLLEKITHFDHERIHKGVVQTLGPLKVK